MNNRSITNKEEAFKGAEVYKKTPEEKQASKDAKKAHKEWLKSQKPESKDKK